MMPDFLDPNLFGDSDDIPDRLSKQLDDLGGELRDLPENEPEEEDRFSREIALVGEFLGQPESSEGRQRSG